MTKDTSFRNEKMCPFYLERGKMTTLDLSGSGIYDFVKALIQ